MDPRVLLLDEATLALDAESESIVARAIQKAMVGRTTLIVAHRLSTVQNADRIVVIDCGSIVDIGRHSELLERCNKYQDLVRRQLTGGAPLEGKEDGGGDLTPIAPMESELADPAGGHPATGTGVSMKQPLLLP